MLRQLMQMHRSKTLGENSDAFWSFAREAFWWYAAVLTLCVFVVPDRLWIIGICLAVFGVWMGFVWLLEHIADRGDPSWRKQLRRKHRQDDS